jgi:hypothetical protein
MFNWHLSDDFIGPESVRNLTPVSWMGKAETAFSCRYTWDPAGSFLQLGTAMENIIICTLW